LVEKKMITLTENAAKHIKTLQTEQSAAGEGVARVCGRGWLFWYGIRMAFDDKKAEDEVVAQDGVES